MPAERGAMDQARLRALLDRVAAGDLSATAAAGELRALPYRDLGFARIDHHRALRDALPEVVRGEGKTPEQVVAAAREILAGADRVLVTRAAPEAAVALDEAFPDCARIRPRRRSPSTAGRTCRRRSRASSRSAGAAPTCPSSKRPRLLLS